MAKQFLITLLLIITPTIYSLERTKKVGDIDPCLLLDYRFVSFIVELQGKSGVAKRVAAGNPIYISHADFYMGAVLKNPALSLKSPLAAASLEMQKRAADTKPLFAEVTEFQTAASQLDKQISVLPDGSRAKTRLLREREKLTTRYKSVYKLSVYLEERLHAPGSFLDYMCYLENSLRAKKHV